MTPFKIGVMADSFRKDIREGARAAKALGADGIQIYAVAGKICPENMDAAARLDFRKFCDDLNLSISALCGDLGGHGFAREAENKGKIERSKKIVDLAVDLGTAVVTTHIGVVPSDPAHPTYQVLKTACRELGAYAGTKGIAFAIETGPEPATVLKAFLVDVAEAGIGVNLDPANLVMVIGDDPIKAAELLGPHIVHTHAKDGRRLKVCDASRIYDAFAENRYGELVKELGGAPFEEVPVGEGEVRWDAYLAALRKAGYHGYLTVEREVGADPSADIGKAVRYLCDRMAAM